MDIPQTQSNKPLKTALFERIKHDNVCPRSRWFFHSRECVMWFLWFLSVVVGALAIAVTLFVVRYQQYALYEATHNSPLIFTVEALPYVWIAVFALMVYVAMYNLRHTKHGYRYPLWTILASSVVVSFAGGSALHMVDLGYSVDRTLGQHMGFYTSQDKYQKKLWQNPREGRLLGVQVYTTLSPTTTIIFRDSTGTSWIMDVSELPELDTAVLASNQTVKLMGMMIREDIHHFHACGVFPWVYQKDMTADVLQAQRQVFNERIKEHARKAEVQRLALAPALASTTLPQQSVCATITPVRRLPLSQL